VNQTDKVWSEQRQITGTEQMFRDQRDSTTQLRAGAELQLRSANAATATASKRAGKREKRAPKSKARNTKQFQILKLEDGNGSNSVLGKKTSTNLSFHVRNSICVSGHQASSVCDL
jgi:uncharacterized protein YdaU (DUF1376 family)